MLRDRELGEGAAMTRVLNGALAGLGVAGTIAIAGVGRALFLVNGERDIAPITGNVLSDLNAVVLASVAAGAVVGGLWPVRRKRVGAYLLGYLAAGIMFGAIVWSAMATDGIVALRECAIVAGATTFICGTVFGSLLWRAAGRPGPWR